MTTPLTVSDADKLRVLALWFDMWDAANVEKRQRILVEDASPARNDVQRDLRRIADDLDRERRERVDPGSMLDDLARRVKELDWREPEGPVTYSDAIKDVLRLIGEPRTKAGKALLERESLNSRSFALIRPEEIVAIEQEATRAVLVEVLRSGDDIFDVVHRLAAE